MVTLLSMANSIQELKMMADSTITLNITVYIFIFTLGKKKYCHNFSYVCSKVELSKQHHYKNCHSCFVSWNLEVFGMLKTNVEWKEKKNPAWLRLPEPPLHTLLEWEVVIS